jgi:hypothetical protein
MSSVARAVLPLFLVLAVPGAAFGQAVGSSTRGTEFWSCPLENRENSLTQPFGIVVANAGGGPAMVRILDHDGVRDQAEVPAGDLHVFSFPPDHLMGTVREALSYRVLSDVPVSVVQFNPLQDPASPVDSFSDDASTLLPVQALGTTYRVVSWQDETAGTDTRPGLLAIVGTAPGTTTVTVHPRGAIAAGFLPATPAGSPVTFTLAQYEVAQLATASAGADFTGSLVESDQPCAVFSGGACMRVPDGVNFCDHLEEQIFPVPAWGRTFVVAKETQRPGEPDVFRVVASEDATLVTTTPDVLGGTRTIDAGEFVEFMAGADLLVEASAPVELGQYFVGRTYTGNTTGDPSLMLAVPVEQWDTDYVFLTPLAYDEDYVNVARPAGATVRLDGVLVPDSEFRRAGTSGFEVATLAVADGRHRISASLGLGVQAYGYDVDVSYAYFAGARVEPLSSVVRCDPGGPYVVPCAGTSVRLDGTVSSGPGPLEYTWTPRSGEILIADPRSAITDATLLARTPQRVRLTVRGSDGSSSWCEADVVPAGQAGVPAGLSEGGGAPYLRVARLAGVLRLTFEDRPGGEEALNAYVGTLPRTHRLAYDHAPIACSEPYASVGGSTAELYVPLDPGASHYYLVSSSTCLGESTRGWRSDGIERPSLPTDCGASP